MSKLSLTYVISDSGHRDRISAYEWYATSFHDTYNLTFIILKGNEYLKRVLNQLNIEYTDLNYSGKNKFQVIVAIFQVVFLLIKNRPNIIHTHYYDANFLGLTAAKMLGIKKRIYTRHHGNANHIYNPVSVKYDKYFNDISTQIIAVSLKVKEILKLEKAAMKKVEVIHHGFDFELMMNNSKEETCQIREKYKLEQGKVIIGIVASYNELKGIQYIIPAFKKLLQENSDAILVLANAKGDYALEIKKMIDSLPVDNVREINYENDIYNLYKTFSVFVHAPIDPSVEAFGQVYVEALACSIPSVFTLSGVASEFIINEENALVVDFKNSDQIYEAIQRLLNDKVLSKKIQLNGVKDAQRLFSLDKMVNKMNYVYSK